MTVSIWELYSKLKKINAKNWKIELANGIRCLICSLGNKKKEEWGWRLKQKAKK